MEPLLSYDDLVAKRESMLAILRPFGFEDGNDGENPCVLYHRRTRTAVDMSASDPYRLIDVMALEIFEKGRLAAINAIRESMGIRESDRP